ncbi:MAG TPA: PilX N-terminal domain-containing pilus assembly protein, partial [Xanthomonadales bacterium]|nr:PilX N-terminal domain-containing pilus assembly protein [Xanthomonadales bacterium]
MNYKSNIHKQQGVALILSLLLLFVLVILGVAGFSNTHMQERSAGNALLQTMAFEAASAGANDAINFFDANRESGDDVDCGATGHTGWANPTAWGAPVEVKSGDHRATYRSRMYCLADTYPCLEADEDAGLCTSEDRPVRSQLFVLSRGEVWSPDDNVIAQRDVEVRLEVGNPGGGPGDGCTAICFPGCEMGDLAFPTSNSFQVDGNGEPAITAGCQSAADAITGAIRANRIGNYYGGIESVSPGSPWDDVNTVEQFRQNLESAAIAAQGAGTCQGPCYLSGADGAPFVDNGNTTYGTVGDPQITYVEGDVEMGGNISGAGIFVVNGNLNWNGTPDFKGLILVLGGTYEVIGGGTGGDHG